LAESFCALSGAAIRTAICDSVEEIDSASLLLASASAWAALYVGIVTGISAF